MPTGWIIGVDEAGRGPLAGPVTLAAFFAPYRFRGRLIQILGGKIRDSKQLSARKRFNIYCELLKFKKAGKISFCAAHVSNSIIDSDGISYATRLGIKRCLNGLKISSLEPEESRPAIKLYLDGLLKAPSKFESACRSKTIIGGDGKNVFIACASIVAKVRRDRLMLNNSKKHPQYSFENNKGYGTSLHRVLIKRYGFCEIHRKTFCTRI